MNIKKAKRGSPHKYELSLKRKVCAELLSGQITSGDLARKYNIPGAGTIMRWVKWFEKEQQDLLTSLEMNGEPINSLPEADRSSVTLQEELRLTKAKIITLETMIDIAEEQFNIEIRKKSGTKPSLE